MDYLMFIFLFLPPLLGVYSFRKDRVIDFIYKYFLFVLIVNFIDLVIIYVYRRFEPVSFNQLFDNIGLWVKYLAISCVVSIILGFFVNLFKKNIKIKVDYKDKKWEK